MKGFGKFVLSIVLLIIGIMIMGGAMATDLLSSSSSSTPFLVAIALGFVCFLGGLYMLTHR